jgi:hypothetical protein
MYTKVNVGRPSTSNAGSGGNRKDKVTFYDLDDVATFPSRDAAGVRITDNITMKPGKYGVQVYGTITTMNDGFTTEGDPDKRGFMPNVSFEHPGDSLEILEFIQNWTNKNIVVILEKCDGSVKKLYGTPCSPLQLNPEAVSSNEENRNTLALESIVKSQFVPAIYEGTLTLATATGVFAANDATPSVANGEGRYELTTNSSANVITTLDDASNGKLYTLVGMGGANPSTVNTAGDFILANGTTWTATAGATLTVRAMAVSGGFKFIEQSRS